LQTGAAEQQLRGILVVAIEPGLCLENAHRGAVEIEESGVVQTPVAEDEFHAEIVTEFDAAGQADRVAVEPSMGLGAFEQLLELVGPENAAGRHPGAGGWVQLGKAQI